jgi:hypothetical protein
MIAGIALVKSAFLLNPVAVTCGAIGEIYFGVARSQQ